MAARTPKPKDPDPWDPSILVPYSRLQELLQVAGELQLLKDDILQLRRQNDALRSQFIELMDTFGDIKSYL